MRWGLALLVLMAQQGFCQTVGNVGVSASAGGYYLSVTINISGGVVMAAPTVSGSLLGINNQGQMFYTSGSNSDNTGKITSAQFSGDGSLLTNINATYPQNVSITALTVSNTVYARVLSSTVVQLVTTTLPLCTASNNRTLRINTASQLCYCNGAEWRDTAPPAVTILGISVLSFATCST